MSNTLDYFEIISEYNKNNVWILKQTTLKLTANQYEAIVKGYQPNIESIPFGLMYNKFDCYFYTYRSGYILGKYLFEKRGGDIYYCTEMYNNLQMDNYLVIFECLRGACHLYNVEYNIEAFENMGIETVQMNEISNS